MAQSNQPSATLILRSHTDFTAWITQLESRCVAYHTWDKINPLTTTIPLSKPLMPILPEPAEYTPAPNITTPLPERPSDLSPAGLKAYKEDLEQYKLRYEAWKSKNREYEKEQSELQHIVVYIQSTVSPHLASTCCLPNLSLRQWIVNLQATVGSNKQIEQDRARERYHAALRPMKNPSNWDLWVAEYDEAATQAEKYLVPELMQFSTTSKDFILAINKVAPVWATQFQDLGRNQAGMTRKEMIQRFREHMMVNHPVKTRHRAAYNASEETSYGSFLAEGGATTQGQDGDVHPTEGASSRNRGRPRNQRGGKKSSNNKRPSDHESSSQGGGAKCPACGQRHGVKDCFYLHPDQAPEWWKPNERIVEYIELKRKHDTTFQGILRGQSRARSQTPSIKKSQTPTNVVEETD